MSAQGLVRRLALLTIGWFIAQPAVALAFNIPNSPASYVNDYSSTLSTDEIKNLDGWLASYKQSSTNEIAVVMIKSLDGEAIEDLAVRIFEKWGIGQKDKDNGVLLLVAKDDHRLRIEVGYGLEGALTDGEAGEIIRNNIAPKFQKNDYYGGLSDGLRAVMTEVSGEVNPSAPTPTSQKSLAQKIESVLIASLVGVTVISYVLAYLARSKHYWLGGVGGGFLGGVLGLLVGGIVAAIIALVTLGAVGLFLDWVLSRVYHRAGKTSWMKSWGGFYGGGGGSGGFGGFGGGGSGGGGASGSW